MSSTVTQLFLYPVKSLRAISLNQAHLTPKGFKWDRHWMIVNSKGSFISQRKYPQMVLIHQRMTESHLVLSKQGIPDLNIALHYQNTSAAFKAKIWKDECDVVDEGQEASAWLSEAIGVQEPLSLVRMAEQHKRPQSKPDLLGSETTTEFADAAPYLICNQNSLDSLNKSMIKNSFKAVTMEHFRPNIVIEKIPAFDEHKLKHIDNTHYSFKLAYPCQRCIMPTVNISTGEYHEQQEPFSLISELNSMPENAKAPAFGENAILLRGKNKTISIGDKLSLTYKA